MLGWHAVLSGAGATLSLALLICTVPATNAFASGVPGEALAVIYMQPRIEQCSTRFSRLRVPLKNAYEKWYQSLQPEWKAFKAEIDGKRAKETANGEPDEFLEKFWRMSNTDALDVCNDALGYLSGKSNTANPKLADPATTWRTFMAALRAGDKEGASKCVAGNARKTLRLLTKDMAKKEMAEVADSFTAFSLSEPFGEFQEAFVSRKPAIAGVITFARFGKNWVIIEM